MRSTENLGIADRWDKLTIEEKNDIPVLKNYCDKMLALKWSELEGFMKNSIVIRWS